MKIAFIEPPKEFWFIMGEYISPPFGLLTLAAYLESKLPEIDIIIIDCQAEGLDWEGLKKRLIAERPNIVAPSSLSTANAFTVLQTVDIAKKLNNNVFTIVGGQHFTALAEETLKKYDIVDVVVRGEGEETLTELVKFIQRDQDLSEVNGISYRNKDVIQHNPDRPLIQDLNSLPYPAYHYVKNYMKKYYFSLMADKNDSFAIVEGSRGCQHNCSYCSQWSFWKCHHRTKTPERIADEFEYIHKKYGTKFFWLTDDNLGTGKHTEMLCDDLIKRNLDITWFSQIRCDDLVYNKEIIPKLRQAGNVWILLGFDSPDELTLEKYRRDGVNKPIAKQAVELLRQHNIFSQGTFIIGGSSDNRKSIEALIEYADWLDPDIATFMALTPFPGTDIYMEAKEKGWINDEDWGNYDMIHSIMPTEYLTKKEVQECLYMCYQTYFGSWSRRYQGLRSKNMITRHIYTYLAKKAILTGLRSLF